MVSGWRFWPERKQGPVDDAYVQLKWVRPYKPGPARLAVTIVVWGLAAYAAFAGYLAITLAQGAANRLITLALSVVIAASLAVLGSRILSTGVWVNDFGVRVLGLVNSEQLSWALVSDVRRVPGPTRVLGTPLRASGEVLWLILADGSDRETPLTDRGPDFLARPEAYDIAAGAIERWFEETRRSD